MTAARLSCMVSPVLPSILKKTNDRKRKNIKGEKWE